MKFSDFWNDSFPPLNLYNCPDTYKHEQWVRGRMFKTVESKGEGMLTIFSRDNCPNCVNSKTILKNHGIKFEEVNIDTDDIAKEWLLSEGYRSVPQIFKDGVLFVENGYAGLLQLWKDGGLNV